MPGFRAEEGTYVAALAADDAAELLVLGHPRRFPHGTTLFTQGDNADRVFIITDGRVKIFSHTDEGREIVLGVRGPGDVVGDMSALDGSPRLASARAMSDVAAVTIGVEPLLSFLDSHPKASMALLRTLVARQRDADEKRMEYLSHDSVGRLARRLVELAERYGEPEDTTITIDLQLTQEELAAWTGSSREATTKALQSFRSSGLIETRRRKIIILDIEKLKRRAI
ncbi:MAG: Crp/Fnr family transcriptional regulator [Actinomycetota bacterium]|nr:Crp/Fnr family transcriptional regulator [Actinomycetota bacterium]